MTAIVEIRDLRTGYDRVPVFDRVSLTVSRGELVALVGANGSGKSTLLKVIAGVLPAWSGTVRVLDGPPGARSVDVAYLPQAEQLRWDFPLLVEDVVLMGRIPRLGLGRRPSRADRGLAAESLERVSAGHLRRRPITDLSGGERQRVLLSRALASEPQLLLLDEPATGVDPATEEQLMEVLGSLAAEGHTVLVSTHDIAGVMAHFRRVVCVNRGIVADGDVSILRDERILRLTYGGHGFDPTLGDHHQEHPRA